LDNSTQHRPSPAAFLGALYDFSFRRFVAPSVLGFVYLIVVAGAALWCAGFVLIGFSMLVTGIPALIYIIGGVLSFVAISLAARVVLETIAAVFRILDHLETPPPA